MMAEEMRIRHKVEGERQHLWWDVDRHFPFMGSDRGWQFCVYCGGLKFKAGEKYIFPTLAKDEKGEDVPVLEDIGCRNFRPVKKEKKEAPAPAPVPEVKAEEKKEPPPEVLEKPEKPAKKGILRNFRK